MVHDGTSTVAAGGVAGGVGVGSAGMGGASAGGAGAVARHGGMEGAEGAELLPPALVPGAEPVRLRPREVAARPYRGHVVSA